MPECRLSLKQSSASVCREFLRGRGCQRSRFPFHVQLRQLRGQLREVGGYQRSCSPFMYSFDSVAGSFVRSRGAREMICRSDEAQQVFVGSSVSFRGATKN